MDATGILVLAVFGILALMILKDLLKTALFLIIAIAGAYYLAKAGYLPENIANAVLNTLSFLDKLDISALLDKISTLADKFGGVVG